MAYSGGGPASFLTSSSALFAVSRLAYVACSIADLSTLRSAVWVMGFLATLSLFVSPVL